MPRVLIVKLGAIGDVVMAIPAAHALHRAGYGVDWVCGTQVLPVLACYPWIRTISVCEEALLKRGPGARLRALAGVWRQLVDRRYDLCATLYYDPRYRMLALLARARRKVWLSESDRDRRLLPGRHHTDEYARVLLGREDGEWPTALAPVAAGGLPPSPLGAVRGRARVVIAPAGARNLMRDDALRRWPAECYVALAQQMIASGLEVVLIGGPDDGWISAFFAGLPVIDMIGKTSVTEMLALLEASDVLVTHDTGPLHLAGITGVGIVSIFGPTDPRGRLPQRANTVALWGGEGFACRPCYDGRSYAPCRHNGCVRQVTEEMVIHHVETMLRERAQGIAAPPRIVTPESTVAAELRVL